MLGKLLLLYHTVRYLRPIQIYSRLKFKLYRPSVDKNIPPSIRVVNCRWNVPIQHRVSLLYPWRFNFLNEENSLGSTRDWDNPHYSKLWRYNLHYFDDLNAVYASSRYVWHTEFLNKWVAENPPAYGTGWEPYPTSLRIVNWIKWSLSGNKLSKECIHSLAIQTRWLSKHLEFHILGNHLLANAKALVFSGLYFDGPEADAWLLTGLNILKREIPEQILQDGGHFERTPMYQAIVLEDLLDLINIAHTFKGSVSKTTKAEWDKVNNKMFHWLQNMLHPDGEISFFNDAAFAIGATYEELDMYAKRLGLKVDHNISSLVHLKESGYIRVSSGDAVGIIDVAPVGPDYLPGHAHADTLSFELSLFGRRIFVNSGTSQYGNDLLRQKQRSTALHNTVTIDEKDSSEVWAGFRVAKRAFPGKPNINVTNNRISISCEHDGFKRLPGKCTHKREWVFEDNSLCVADEITGNYTKAVANYYIHPEIMVTLNKDGRSFNLVLESGECVRVMIENADDLKLVSSYWYPEFGMSVLNKCISIGFSSKNIVVRIEW